MAARLVERDGPRAKTVYPLTAGVTTIGRSSDNDVVVPDDPVSRRHAQIRWDGARFVLEDLGSRNGTFVNGRRLDGPHVLRHGDQLVVPGRTFLVDLAEETSAWQPETPAARGVHVDTATAEVWVDGRPVGVTAKEFLALTLLSGKAGGLVGKEELATAVWPEYQGAVGDYNIEQLISRLRRKLEVEPERPRYLLTVRGLGYRLVAPE